MTSLEKITKRIKEAGVVAVITIAFTSEVYGFDPKILAEPFIEIVNECGAKNDFQSDPTRYPNYCNTIHQAFMFDNYEVREFNKLWDMLGGREQSINSLSGIRSATVNEEFIISHNFQSLPSPQSLGSFFSNYEMEGYDNAIKIALNNPRKILYQISDLSEACGLRKEAFQAKELMLKYNFLVHRFIGVVNYQDSTLGFFSEDEKENVSCVEIEPILGRVLLDIAYDISNKISNTDKVIHQCGGLSHISEMAYGEDSLVFLRNNSSHFSTSKIRRLLEPDRNTDEYKHWEFCISEFSKIRPKLIAIRASGLEENRLASNLDIEFSKQSSLLGDEPLGNENNIANLSEDDRYERMMELFVGAIFKFEDIQTRKNEFRSLISTEEWLLLQNINQNCFRISARAMKSFWLLAEESWISGTLMKKSRPKNVNEEYSECLAEILPDKTIESGFINDFIKSYNESAISSLNNQDIFLKAASERSEKIVLPDGRVIGFSLNQIRAAISNVNVVEDRVSEFFE